MPDAKRRLAAILAADVAGYSRLMGADEEGTIAALDACRAIFRNEIESRQGRVVDTAGDSVLAVFDSVVEAMRCSIDVQDALSKFNADLADDESMKFRIGVNLGDIIEKDDGSVYGDGINLAARLEALAEPGTVCVSESAHMQADGKLDVTFSDVGEHKVKNIARPIRVYRLDTQPDAAAHPKSKTPLKLPDKPSIAVLPFDNMSGDPEQEFFADGLAEDLITALSRIRWLFVTARNSSFSFKGKSLPITDLAAALGVRYVVEGSVRKSANRVRITAQLIDATTDSHVWASRYDRELEDMFAVQEEITEKIAAAVEPEIGTVERTRAMHKPPDSLDTWERYQRGLWHMYQFTREENLKAKETFKCAIDIDSTYGPAHTGLGYAHLLDAIFGFADASEPSIELSYRAVKKALALDDRDPMAHYTLGRLYMLLGDPDLSKVESEHAIQLNPNLALAHFGLGHAIMLLGRSEEGIAEIDLALRLSPNDPILWVFEYAKATALIVLGRYEEALIWARKSTRHPTAGVWAYMSLCSVLGHMQRYKEAEVALQQLLKLKPDFTLGFIKSYLPFQLESDFGLFSDGIRKAGFATAEDK